MPARSVVFNGFRKWAGKGELRIQHMDDNETSFFYLFI